MRGIIMKRIIVCGGRDFTNEALLDQALNHFLGSIPTAELTIVEGDAKGADKMAEAWGNSWDVKVETHKADWDKFGKSAGYKRNQAMLDSKVDGVIAFPGGPGTKMMVEIARKAGVRVVEVAECLGS